MNDVRERCATLQSTFRPATLELIDRVVPAATTPLGRLSRAQLGGEAGSLQAVLPLLLADHLGEDPSGLLPLGAACEVLHEAAQTRPVRGRGASVDLGAAAFHYAVLLQRQLCVDPALRERLVVRFVTDTLHVIEAQAAEAALRQGAQDDLPTVLELLEGRETTRFALPLAGAALVCGQPDDVVDGLAAAARHLGVLARLAEELQGVGERPPHTLEVDLREGRLSALLAAALAHATPEDARLLRRVLSTPRDHTTLVQLAEARAAVERAEGVRHAVAELQRRREAATSVPRVVAEARLHALVTGLVDLVLEPVAGLLARHADADEAFCRDVLPQVSRTFALSIELLPPSLREPVRVGYLLCRQVDTIEDDARLPPAAREALFDAFDAAVEGGEAEALALGALAQAHDCGDVEAERALLHHAERVLRRWRALPEPARDGMRGSVLEMSRGMRTYARRADAEGRLRMRDIPDLERYCYYVAGTVGELLTALFLQACPDLPASARATVEACQVPFGLALQIVNIVKDAAEDLERGACFLPEDVAARHGLDVAQLTDPAHRDAALAVVAEVVVVARGHVEEAIRYTAAWPADGGPGSSVRLFCLVPLLLAIETLAVVVASGDTLVPGRTPKVDRAVVHEVLAAAGRAAGSDEALRELLDRYGLPVPAVA